MKRCSPYDLTPDELIEFTPEWHGERFADGRPRVPDSELHELRSSSVAHACDVLAKAGYAHQHEGGWRCTHPGQVLVGRAFTATYMPSRPGLRNIIAERGARLGRVGEHNSWPLDMLGPDDVYVADIFGRIADGPLIGDNLATSIYSKTGVGVVHDGAVRDLDGIQELPGFTSFVRGWHPTHGVPTTMLMGVNAPTRIGQVTVMPGDVVLGRRDGVVFIPPHLLDSVLSSIPTRPAATSPQASRAAISKLSRDRNRLMIDALDPRIGSASGGVPTEGNTMKLIQYWEPGEGKRVGVLTREDTVIDVTTDDSPGVLELLELSAREHVSLNILVAEMQERASESRPPAAPWETESQEAITFQAMNVPPNDDVRHILLPLDPPEVWGCGVTYKRSSEMRDGDSRSDIYSRVYDSDRPEIFFKATTPRCSPHNAPIGIRHDSTLTATEPELAFVLGADAEIVGYTICNDVSAWDIERDNPLYLPQSKTFNGCCGLGPAFATPAEIDDVYDLDITCTIHRGGEVLWSGSVNTGQINHKFEELAEYLLRDNDCPVGTVVSTGTGIIVPNDLPLQAGDVVEIACPPIGTLSNPVVQFHAP